MRALPVVVVLFALLGCEEKPPEAPALAADSAASERDSGRSPVVAGQSRIDDVQHLETGQYELQLAAGKIYLHAAWASRGAILDELAARTGFELEYPAAIDAPVLVSLSGVGMATLLGQLLEGLDYTARYDAEPRDNGFRLARLSVGPISGDLAGLSESPASAAEIEDTLPQPGDEIYLGTDPEAAGIAARLEFGSVEEQIDALGELEVDPAGLEAAYRVYRRTTSPAVRVAVLELIEGEQTWLAKSMVAASLRSMDPAEVSFALAIVEQQDDYSLAPQVSALRHHYDAGIRKLAAEVLQSITEDYADDRDRDLATEQYGERDPVRFEGESNGVR